MCSLKWFKIGLPAHRDTLCPRASLQYNRQIKKLVPGENEHKSKLFKLFLIV